MEYMLARQLTTGISIAHTVQTNTATCVIVALYIFGSIRLCEDLIA
jgi:hypothetical protein